MAATAYETGTANTMSDFVTALFSFAVTNGWTQDELVTGSGQAAMHKDSVYVSFRWATSSPTQLAIYQALGYSGGQLPGNHTNDSGNGLISGTDATLEESRGFHNIGSGPYTSYHFFLGTSPDYIHIVLEFEPGVFRHCGFGELDKYGDWTGGEYCYGHAQDSGTPTSTVNTALLDALWFDISGNEEHRGWTLHMEGFKTQPAAGKWATQWPSLGSTGFLTDRDGNPRERAIGGYRGGTIARSLGWIATSTGSGFVPFYSIPVFWFDETTSPTDVVFLGYQPDVRGMNIKAFDPKQTVTIGGQTWQVFPLCRKQNTLGATVEESRNSGIAYLRP